MIAQAHIVERDGQLDNQARDAELSGRTDYVRPGTEFLGAKEIYDETISALKEANFTPNNLADNFLNEKSLNVSAISSKRSTLQSAPAMQLKEKSEQDSSAAVDEEDHEIRKRIQSIMQEYTQSNATEGRGISDHELEMDPKYWRIEQQVV